MSMISTSENYKNDCKDWSQYFEHQIKNSGGLVGWVRKKMISHNIVVEKIKTIVPSEGKILEVGCGSGINSIITNGLGYKNTAVDIDGNVLKFAKKLNQSLGTSVNFIIGDMYKLQKYYNKFDLVYSGGVVEHLNRKDIVRFLKEQAKTAKYVFIVLPTKYEKEASPSKRYNYNINDMVQFGNLAGLKTHSCIAFYDIESKFARFIKQTLPSILYSFLRVKFSYARRIGVVFQNK